MLCLNFRQTHSATVLSSQSFHQTSAGSIIDSSTCLTVVRRRYKLLGNPTTLLNTSRITTGASSSTSSIWPRFIAKAVVSRCDQWISKPLMTCYYTDSVINTQLLKYSFVRVAEGRLSLPRPITTKIAPSKGLLQLSSPIS